MLVQLALLVFELNPFFVVERLQHLFKLVVDLREVAAVLLETGRHLPNRLKHGVAVLLLLLKTLVPGIYFQL